MSRRTTRPTEATSTSATLQAQLRDGLGRLRQPTRELLSSLKDATGELRRLALVTSPFAIRAELIAHGLASEQSETGHCELTALGLAALELSQPLTRREQEQLAAEADRALADSTSETDTRATAEATSVQQP